MIKFVSRLKSEQGASSVLIILMMLVLIVFGLAALTTSLAAKRLGEKSVSWLMEYYSLEAKANETLFDMDGLLTEAEKTAVEYIENKEYISTESSVLPAGIQESINRNFTHVLPEQEKEAYLTKVMQAVYYKYALDSLIKEYPRFEFNYSSGYMREILEDEGFTGVSISYTVSEEESVQPKNLDISLDIVTPLYELEIEGEKVTVTRLPVRLIHYDITEWREWQELFDYSDETEFEDIF